MANTSVFPAKRLFIQQSVCRTIKRFGIPGDVLVGNSKNVVKVMKYAKDIRITTIGLTGEAGGEMANRMFY